LELLQLISSICLTGLFEIEYLQKINGEKLVSCEQCDRVSEQLGIDINLFFKDLQETQPTSYKLSGLDHQIICTCLLGKERIEIAKLISQPESFVRDHLNKYIYPKIDNLMSMGRIAGKWTLILNWLLDPKGKYRLNSPTQFNTDNFQASFGRQVFLYSHDREIGNAQIHATRYYQSGAWYLAQQCFLFAWKKGKQLFKSGSPEILIYINNCAIEYHQEELLKQQITVYTIAVVVPAQHDRGQIAAETLQGIAQIQLQLNAKIKLLELNELATENLLASYPLTNRKIALKVLIVNDINNLHDGHDRTAENLAKLSARLNLIAIIGNYSSEATQRSVPVYAQASIALVNSSSTSDRLSYLEFGEQLSFFRIPPRDSTNAKRLVKFLGTSNAFPHLPKKKKVSIIYAKNSIYSNSYRQAVENELRNKLDDFEIISSFDYIGEDDLKSKNYMAEINRIGIDIVIMMIDARIEPNFLANTGMLSELNLEHCVLAGSATLYKQNFNCLSRNSNPHIVSCLPWHWHSQSNGYQSSNSLANSFCALADSLWGAEKVTWRSATAFDSVLLLDRILQQFSTISDSKILLEQMHRSLKVQRQQIPGVTGQIKFQENGDRLEPPTEIVKLAWNEAKQKWQWDCV
jgi:branched-chain amino acid transport system substrate-binding protein